MPSQHKENAFISPSGFYKESLFSSVLSSTTAITDANGSLTQHVLYFAYGEQFVDEHRNSTNSPYLFNGKEYDEETGRYYYGARYYDPRVSLWIGVDPLAGQVPNYSPYRYGLNNPISFIDPTGMIETKYKDENSKLILETKDGSDAVVTVTKDKRAGFDAAVKGTTNTDDPAWNKNMKAYVLGFELSDAQETVLCSLNSDWSRSNALTFWQNPTPGNAAAFSFSEALSQWTNPYHLVGALSAGVAGLESVTPRTTVYRVYGGDSPAKGYSWTPTNPNTVPNFRNAAGLPSGGASGAINSGRFVVEGTVKPSYIMNQRPAIPLDGNAGGGVIEYLINPISVKITRVSGANPEF